MDKKEKHRRNAKYGWYAMIQDLHFRYMMGVEKLKDIIYFMHHC